MVVLSAAITTKAGKTLLARQFVEMSRIRIEGLLAAFPKLIGTGKQHTFVETEAIRYVYQPIENMYLLLITNKSSNIMEDLDTLRILAKIVPEFCPTLEEEHVQENAFELVFAFDEVLANGYRDNVTLQQIKTSLEMESYEEKVHNMIVQSKQNEAKEEAKRRAQQIDKQKSEAKKMDGFGSSGMGSMGGMGGGSSMGGPKDVSSYEQSYSRPVQNEPPPKPSKPMMKGKGMQLGKKSTTVDYLKQMQDEGEVVELPSAPSASAGTSSVVKAARPEGPTEPVHLLIEEKMSVTLERDGGIATELEVKGDLSLKLSDPNLAQIIVHLQQGNTSAFQFKTHPNIDKNRFGSHSVLAHKDPSKPFPTGNALGILKWRMQTKDESVLPITFNAWPSANGNNASMNIEFELQNQSFEAQNVVVSIPSPDAPSVQQASGHHRYDSRNGRIEWTIDLIDSDNSAGSMEFSVANCQPAAFFPISIQFTSPKPFCDIAISEVSNAANNQPIKYSKVVGLAVEDFQIA